MMNTFPIPVQEADITSMDFKRFSFAFTEILLKEIPTASAVTFFPEQDMLFQSLEQHGIERQDAEKAIKMGDQYGVTLCGPLLILSFKIENGDSVTAVVSGIEPEVARRFGFDWLQETRGNILAQLILFKQARFDQSVGLLNGTNLHFLLRKLESEKNFTLVLIDLPPAKRSVKTVFHHIRKGAAELDSLLGSDYPVHYLGQHIYGFVTSLVEVEKLNQLCRLIIGHMKNDSRVHIGFDVYLNETDKTLNTLPLFDRAWSALVEASSRGPYGYCNYGQIAHPELHKLFVLSERQYRSLLSVLKRFDAFSLVKIGFRRGGDVRELEKYLNREYPHTYIFNEKLFLLLEGKRNEKRLASLQHFISRYSEEMNRKHLVDAGVAFFPHNKYTRKQTIINCSKALIHATYFEEQSFVEFDCVSLNISGDILFAEGNIAGAIKEYRQGVGLNCSDINLLNSMGVAYVNLEKTGHGFKCFLKVLELDEENLMALYNLGLCSCQKGKVEEAIFYFNRALKVVDPEKDGIELDAELRFQLGRLNLEKKDYHRAARLLNELEEKQECRYLKPQVKRMLGMALYGIGEYKKSAKYLQHAVSMNKYDGLALSYLGIVYLKQRQGNEIARSLCLQGCELLPDNLQLKLHLAIAEMACGNYGAAYPLLKRCLRFKSTRNAAAKEMVVYYRGIDNEKRANYWKRKVQERFD